jgi:hypothetical protein
MRRMFHRSATISHAPEALSIGGVPDVWGSGRNDLDVYLVFFEAKSAHDLFHQVQDLPDLISGLGGQAKDVSIILQPTRFLSPPPPSRGNIGQSLLAHLMLN